MCFGSCEADACAPWCRNDGPRPAPSEAERHPHDVAISSCHRPTRLQTPYVHMPACPPARMSLSALRYLPAMRAIVMSSRCQQPQAILQSIARAGETVCVSGPRHTTRSATPSRRLCLALLGAKARRWPRSDDFPCDGVRRAVGIPVPGGYGAYLRCAIHRHERRQCRSGGLIRATALPRVSRAGAIALSSPMTCLPASVAGLNEGQYTLRNASPLSWQPERQLARPFAHEPSCPRALLPTRLLAHESACRPADMSERCHRAAPAPQEPDSVWLRKRKQGCAHAGFVKHGHTRPHAVKLELTTGRHSISTTRPHEGNF